MDWSSLTPLIAGAAPTIGSLLGGFIPFPGGAILGQVAGKMVAQALGVPPTPEAVKEAIETRDPAEVQTQLSKAEVLMRTEVEKLRIELEQFKAQTEDTQDARGTTVKLAEAGSPIAWGAPVVSVLVVTGFFSCVMMLFIIKIDLPPNVAQLLNVLFGVLIPSFGQVINYYLGSSAGSKDKTNTIAAMAVKPIVKK